MRVRLIVLSAIMGCLSLLLGPEPGRTQIPGGPIRSPSGRPGTVERTPRQDAGNGQLTRPGMPPPRPPFSTPGAPFVQHDPFAWADARFLPLDRNGDGLLSYEEMTENLRAERARWDANADGQIDLDEWREYVRAIVENRRRPAADSGERPLDGGVKERPGGKKTGGVSVPKLPPRDKGEDTRPRDPTSFLPPWLQGCDADRDGQVALYEWKEKNGTLSDFKELDLNGDGFVTLAELIRVGHARPPQDDTPLPDPGNPRAFRGQVGVAHYFEVTGRMSGSVWGTDLYTDDSLIATAAVHAGVLQVGQQGIVKVTMAEGQPSYTGSTRNGITSSNYGPWASSFRIEAVRGARPRGGR